MKLDTQLNLLKKRIENATGKHELLSIRSALNYEYQRKVCLALSFLFTFGVMAQLPQKKSNHVQSSSTHQTVMSLTKFQPVWRSFRDSSTFNTRDIYNGYYYYLTMNELASEWSKKFPIMTKEYFFRNYMEESSKICPIAWEESEAELKALSTDVPFEAEEKVPTNEEKIETICERYQLTREEFTTIVAVVIAESQGNSYEDAYAVINTIFNRSISAPWIYDVERLQGEGTGTSMYHQVTQYHQFDVYWLTGSYTEYLGATPEEYPGMQAVIDFLYGVPVTSENGETKLLPQRLHDCVNFVGYGIHHRYEAHSYTSRGNNYGVHMQPEDYISYDFTEISEEEVEQIAAKVELDCKNYKEGNIQPEDSTDEEIATGSNKVLVYSK